MERKLRYNLQFFADGAEPEEGASVENVEVAEPQEIEEQDVETPESNGELERDNEEPEKQIDVNAVAAAARRQAEQDAKSRQQAIDAEYARRFGNYQNPITGQPIRSQADYLEAYDAQEQLKAKQQIVQSGVDPSLIDQLINNNPVIRQAQEVMERAKAEKQVDAILSDVSELSKFDQNIKGLQDVPPEVVQKCMEVPGLRLPDAYKLVNYGKVSSSQADAIKQSAINQAKGKQHLNPVNGISTPDRGVDIPSSEMTLWKDMFPDKSASELKKLYNETL